MFTHVLKKIKHAIALVKSLNEDGVNVYKAWVCDSSQQHLLHLTPRRADDVKLDKAAFIATCSDIAVFKLVKDHITYTQFRDARTELQAIMTGEKEVREDYVKQKKQMQVT